MRPLNKKGMSLNDMYPAVITIVLIGVLLGAGLYILAALSDGIQTSYSGSQVGINTTSGSTTLTDASKTSFNLSSIDTSTYNNGTAITNYTFTGAGVITWGADIVAQAGAQTVNLTYTYTYDADGKAETALTSVITGLDDFASWIGIIVVVIAAAIVLGVVFSSFGRKRASI